MQGHEGWLKIATEDLLVSKYLLKHDLFSTVVYHAQQSAEKMLKGFLAFYGHEILKTHDLSMLVRLCSKLDKDFEKLNNAAEYLNPFATRFRYPTEFDIPDKQAAEFAIKHAQQIMTFVTKKLLEPKRGQLNML